MDVLLIRHGQSQWNVDQTGGADAPLTALGREQARRAGIYLKRQFRLEALYASSYIRARDTAMIINSFLNLPRVAVVNDLREFDEDYSPFMPRFDLPTAVLDLTKPIPPAAVSDYYVEFQARVCDAVKGILSAHADRYETSAQIGIVSHGGTMGTVLRTLTGSHHYSLITENTGIHLLRWREGRWHLLALNRVEHLECDEWSHEPGKDA